MRRADELGVAEEHLEARWAAWFDGFASELENRVCRLARSAHCDKVAIASAYIGGLRLLVVTRGSASSAWSPLRLGGDWLD